MTHRFVVGAEAPLRLDRFLAERLPDASRRLVRELCAEGAVRVNGRRARGGVTLAAGDAVEVALAPAPPAARPALGAALSPAVLFEDAHLLVVSKPRAVHSVTLAADDPPTLADWLAAYAPACATASPDPREAGLVQRLDFYTSGALLAARTRPAWEALRAALFAGAVAKTYLALVEGHPARDTWTCALPLRARGPRGRMEAVAPDTPGALLAACTEVEVFRRLVLPGGPAAVVRARAPRARRHQVRVHLAVSGHPLVGDTQYGSMSDAAALGDATLPGFLLHAATLAFAHPVTGQRVEAEAPSPVFAALLTPPAGAAGSPPG